MGKRMKLLHWIVGGLIVLIGIAVLAVPRVVENRYNRVESKAPYRVWSNGLTLLVTADVWPRTYIGESMRFVFWDRHN